MGLVVFDHPKNISLIPGILYLKMDTEMIYCTEPYFWTPKLSDDHYFRTLYFRTFDLYTKIKIQRVCYIRESVNTKDMGA